MENHAMAEVNLEPGTCVDNALSAKSTSIMNPSTRKWINLEIIRLLSSDDQLIIHEKDRI